MHSSELGITEGASYVNKCGADIPKRAHICTDLNQIFQTGRIYA